ncbi:hypothetical protein ACQKWADRAFT_302212 [Trichoderma austrokoningii]
MTITTGRVPARFRGHCSAIAGCCTVPARWPVGGRWQRATTAGTRSIPASTWAVRGREPGMSLRKVHPYLQGLMPR